MGSSSDGGSAPSGTSSGYCASFLQHPLPAGLANAWQLTTVSHATHADTGQAELTEVAAWTNIVGFAVSYSCSRCVNWLEVQLQLWRQGVLSCGDQWHMI